MKNLITILVVFTFCTFNLSAQQECQFLKEFNFYDYEQVKSYRDRVKMSLYFLKQIESNDYQSAKSTSANLSVPIEGIVVGAGYQDTEGEYRKFRKELLEQSIDIMTDRIVQNTISAKINIGMVEVLKDCINKLPTGFHPIVFYSLYDENIVIIKLIYNSKENPSKKAKLKISSVSPNEAITSESYKKALSEKYCLKMFRNESVVLERDSCNGFAISFKQINDFVFEETFVEVKPVCKPILPNCPEIKIVTVPTVKSSLASHPTCTLEVKEPGLKIISGGARILNKDGKSESNEKSYLTASYPTDDNKKWIVKAKDHGVVNARIVEAYALAIYDPFDEWDVRVKPDNSGTNEHFPDLEVGVNNGYVITGGGARANWEPGAGNILTASYPNSDNSWFAKSKDHDLTSLANITVYSIGIKPKQQCKQTLEIKRFPKIDNGNKKTKEVTSIMDGGEGWILVGGGAFADWRSTGSLLTGSYPIENGWIAKSVFENTAPLTAYSIGIRYKR